MFYASGGGISLKSALHCTDLPPLGDKALGTERVGRAGSTAGVSTLFGAQVKDGCQGQAFSHQVVYLI